MHCTGPVGGLHVSNLLRRFGAGRKAQNRQNEQTAGRRQSNVQLISHLAVAPDLICLAGRGSPAIPATTLREHARKYKSAERFVALTFPEKNGYFFPSQTTGDPAMRRYSFAVQVSESSRNWLSAKKCSYR
jgi:hypothetical protein